MKCTLLSASRISYSDATLLPRAFAYAITDIALTHIYVSAYAHARQCFGTLVSSSFLYFLRYSITLIREPPTRASHNVTHYSLVFLSISFIYCQLHRLSTHHLSHVYNYLDFIIFILSKRIHSHCSFICCFSLVHTQITNLT